MPDRNYNTGDGLTPIPQPDPPKRSRKPVFTVEDVQRAERTRLLDALERFASALRHSGYSYHGEQGSAHVAYGNGQTDSAWRLSRWIEEQRNG